MTGKVKIVGVKIHRRFVVTYSDGTVLEIPQEKISNEPLTEKQYLYAIGNNINKEEMEKELDDSNRAN